MEWWKSREWISGCPVEVWIAFNEGNMNRGSVVSIGRKIDMIVTF